MAVSESRELPGLMIALIKDKLGYLSIRIKPLAREPISLRLLIYIL